MSDEGKKVASNGSCKITHGAARQFCFTELSYALSRVIIGWRNLMLRSYQSKEIKILNISFLVVEIEPTVVVVERQSQIAVRSRTFLQPHSNGAAQINFMKKKNCNIFSIKHTSVNCKRCCNFLWKKVQI